MTPQVETRNVDRLTMPNPEWSSIHDELPRRGQDVWLYDSMFGNVMAWTVVCSPERIDGDISHWMPRKGMTKPKPPSDGKIHAKGFPKDEADDMPESIPDESWTEVRRKLPEFVIDGKENTNTPVIVRHPDGTEEKTIYQGWGHFGYAPDFLPNITHWKYA